ncbi:MAG: hypothetical protein H6797_04025 [Candidatus Nomurabacteria bacterium]|nr:MAG: hypothetical protein H6797_04025 [Candidatus Nomurabacteria bacterium]
MGDAYSRAADGSKIHVVDGVSTNWVIGWKGAYASVAPDLRTLRFKPLIVNAGIYGVNDKAVCFGHRPKHKVPGNLCRCGFNAWDNDDLAMRYIGMYHESDIRNMQSIGTMPRYGWLRSMVLLRVGMHGDVIEGTLDAGKGWDKWGYRASDQRVADVFFDDCCAACGAKAKYLCAMSKEHVHSDALLPLRSFCAQHSRYGQYVLQKASLSERNHVDIHWGPPS